ncbi:MAG: hypothetical protein FWF83_05850, partial [Clostridiales bacterium]|nr:hypothetical protein [Clostridiales bacterium]
MANNDNFTDAMDGGSSNSGASNSGGKKKGGFFRRDRKSADKGNDRAKAAQEDKPMEFHAHALEMEPGFVAPERQSIDLTYNDFTRESYDAKDRRPFVPVKRNLVPYELSETPRSQQEPQENRGNERRRPAREPARGAAQEPARGAARESARGEAREPARGAARESARGAARESAAGSSAVQEASSSGQDKPRG